MLLFYSLATVLILLKYESSVFDTTYFINQFLKKACIKEIIINNILIENRPSLNISAFSIGCLKKTHSFDFRCILVCVIASTSNVSSFRIITRREWNAKPPTEIVHINHKVHYVIIHHSYIPAECYTQQKCIEAMQSMQKSHQEVNHWEDIGYS